jgi:N-[(2S)-2-amino-2-carboxyethyl]-L-glutamate dehydrogenase
MSAPPPDSLLYLTRNDIEGAVGSSFGSFIDTVTEALIAHSRGATCQPLKPYLRPPGSENPYDRLIAMPAYVDGESPAIGLKWIGSKQLVPGSRQRERASALIVLNDPETHRPTAIMEGGLISGRRTAAVTVAAARHLARSDAEAVAIVGCGFIGSLHAYALAEDFPAAATIYLYDSDPDAMTKLLLELRERGVDVRSCSSAEEAVKSAPIVAACTVASTPTIQDGWLAEGSFLCNVSLVDATPQVYLRTDKFIVDDWEQSNRPGKIVNDLVSSGQFSRTDLHAELGDVLDGSCEGRSGSRERIVLNPMGLAVEDVACGAFVYRRALERGLGRWLPLM